MNEHPYPIPFFCFTLSPSYEGFRTTSPTPSPYATANLLPVNGCNNNIMMAGETIYSKPESICPSHISYYASSQLTQVGGSIPQYSR